MPNTILIGNANGKRQLVRSRCKQRMIMMTMMIKVVGKQILKMWIGLNCFKIRFS